MSTMLLKLWNSTVHLEGKFLRTCWQLFVPAKITLEFFKGRQGRYPHPLRMFAVVMFLFLFMLNLMMKNRKDGDGSLLTITSTAKTEKGDSVVDKRKLPFYENVKYRAMLNDMRQDFENLPQNWKTEASRNAFDSIMSQYNLRYGAESVGLPEDLASELDTATLNFFTAKPIRLATADMVRYDADEIIRRYRIEHWSMKLLVRQTLKSFKSPEGLAHAYIGSLTWAILALVTLMSGFLALLYWRQKRFYVEHFIFLLHYHTGIMLAALLAMLGMMFRVWDVGSLLLVFLWASVSMYLGMKRYYQQSTWKTVLKWLIYGLIYYISFGLLFIMGAVLVFAIY
jgi:Protein of unknown function (DUF3667)